MDFGKPIKAASRVLLVGAFALAAGAFTAQSQVMPDRVEVIIADLSNPFFSHLAREIEHGLAEILPGAEVAIRSSGYDLNRQQQQIDGAIAAGADFMIVNAVSSGGLAPVLARARQAGIPVVAVDVGAEGADAFVTSDNFSAGELACAYIGQRLGGQGNVLILYGPPVSAVIDRNAGCAAALAVHPGIRILSERGDSGGSRTGGLTYMSSILPRIAHIDAVFSFNDPTSLGVLEAAREAGRSEFFVVSVDASPEGLAAMATPGGQLAASVAQYPRAMARESIKLALTLWRGDEPASRAITVPVRLVTADMLDQSGNYWEDPL